MDDMDGMAFMDTMDGQSNRHSGEWRSQEFSWQHEHSDMQKPPDESGG